ncbi:hypothetical protein [Candidatus Hadarchaeum sp.]|uniref:hypothetical protein n=1 Tax=Candidatus Hadarchaeum sp. TaxID=2883567 RepID=UPI003D0CB9E3
MLDEGREKHPKEINVRIIFRAPFSGRQEYPMFVLVNTCLRARAVLDPEGVYPFDVPGYPKLRRVL